MTPITDSFIGVFYPTWYDRTFTLLYIPFTFLMNRKEKREHSQTHLRSITMILKQKKRDKGTNKQNY